MKKRCLAIISGLFVFGCDPDVTVSPVQDCPVSPEEVIECAKAFEKTKAQVAILEAEVARLQEDLEAREDQLAVCVSSLSTFDDFFIVCHRDHNKCINLNTMKRLVDRGAEVGRCDDNPE